MRLFNSFTQPATCSCINAWTTGSQGEEDRETNLLSKLQQPRIDNTPKGVQLPSHLNDDPSGPAAPLEKHGVAQQTVQHVYYTTLYDYSQKQGARKGCTHNIPVRLMRGCFGV